MSDLVKVDLRDDYERGEYWFDYDPKFPGMSEPYEIPREQRDRWREVMDAYEQMQAEIEALMKARAEAKMAERRRNDTTRRVYLRP